MKLSTTLKRLLTQANPRPKRPVLSIVGEGSDLEQDFAGLWRAHGSGPDPAREWPFAKHLGRRWRFDFAWPEHSLAVELEGLFRFGDVTHHQQADGYQNDCDKYNQAILLGWRVLRFTSLDLKRRPLQLIEMVETLLAAADVGYREGR